jgi:hypothetical protein
LGRARRTQLALAGLLLYGGCLPFFGGKAPKPGTPAAVWRFAAAASQLGLPPSPPPLAEVTRLLAGAVESLPATPGGHERGQEIDAQARAMRGIPAEDEPRARQSLAAALHALEQMKKPAGSKKDRAHALEDVRQALGVGDSYRAVARALVLFTGSRLGLAAYGTLPALVARLSEEDDDTARRTGAQAVFAVGEALRALHGDAGDLSDRAEKLAHAAPLEYAPALHDALERAVAGLRRLDVHAPGFTELAKEAEEAVGRVARPRPFELQRAAAQDALRLITDALTVARSSSGGR